MKLTVTGVSKEIINYKDKKSGLTRQAVVVGGEYLNPQMIGKGSKEYFVDLSLLGGVIPSLGDVLLIDLNNNFPQSVEWLSHASASAPIAPHAANNYGAKPEGKTNENGTAK